MSADIGVRIAVFALIACGEVGVQPSDAPPPRDDAPPVVDAPADVPTDAPPGTVKITALTYAGDGQPDLLARMIFQDPDGSVVFEGAVDAMGKLEALLPTGGTVTEIRTVIDTPTVLRAELTTITGVQPGDDLTFGLKPPPTITNQGGQTTMTASFTPFPGATEHVFYTSCGTVNAGITSPVTLKFRDSCHGAAFDLVVVASGGGTTPPRFVKLTDITYSNGQQFAVPAIYSAMTDFAVNAMNLPAETSGLTVIRSSVLGRTPVATQSVAFGDPSSASASVLVPFPPGVGSRSEVSLTVARPDVYGVQQHGVHTQTLSASLDVDFARQQLPWFAMFSPTPTGLTWTLRAAGDQPDGMVAQWQGTWTVDDRTTSIVWRIAQPFADQGLTLPRLPATHAAFDPQAQTVAVTPQSVTVSVVDYDIITSYDAFRAQPDTLVVPFLSFINAFVDVPYQRRLYTATATP